MSSRKTVYARLQGGVLELRDTYMRVAEELPRYKQLNEAVYVLLSWLQPVKFTLHAQRVHGWSTLTFKAEADVDMEWSSWWPATGWAGLWLIIEDFVRHGPLVKRLYAGIEQLNGRYEEVKVRLEMGYDWFAPPGRRSTFARSIGNAVYLEGDEKLLHELLDVLRRGRRKPWRIESTEGRIVEVDVFGLIPEHTTHTYKLRIWDEHEMNTF